MDEIAGTLLNLTHTAALCRGGLTGLCVLPLGQMLRIAFHNLAPTDLIERCASAITGGSASAEPEIRGALGQLQRTILQRVDQRPTEERLRAVYQASSELRALAMLCCSPMVGGARLVVRRPGIFDFVLALAVAGEGSLAGVRVEAKRPGAFVYTLSLTDGAGSGPLQIVVGHAPPRPAGLTLGFGPGGPGLQKIDLSYRPGEPWPWLRVEHRATADYDAMAHQRYDWPQVGAPTHDLTLLSSGRKIMTRQGDGHAPVVVGPLSLELTAESHVAPVTTTIAAPGAGPVLVSTWLAPRGPGSGD
ncbi:MAG: hypothetical protein OHK0015_53020 [Chloroflexi bacterium OHK40]